MNTALKLAGTFMSAASAVSMIILSGQIAFYLTKDSFITFLVGGLALSLIAFNTGLHLIGQNSR